VQTADAERPGTLISRSGKKSTIFEDSFSPVHRRRKKEGTPGSKRKKKKGVWERTKTVEDERNNNPAEKEIEVNGAGTSSGTNLGCENLWKCKGQYTAQGKEGPRWGKTEGGSKGTMGGETNQN